MFEFAKLQVHDRYQRVMQYLKIISVIICIKMTIAQVPLFMDASWFFPFLQTTNALNNIGILLFCLCMYWLATNLDLKHTATHWQFTAGASFLFYFVPFMVILVFNLQEWLVRYSRSYPLDFAAMTMLYIGMSFIPLFCYFLTTTNMKKQLRGMLRTALPRPPVRHRKRRPQPLQT